MDSVKIQMQESEEYLSNFIEEGSEFISNIEVANNAREIRRRLDESSKENERLKNLEKESLEETEKFKEISKWPKLAELNNVLDLYNACKLQQENCAKLIACKDNVINMLKNELSIVDDRYNSDLKIHSDDIKILCRRIDTHIQLMHHAYKQQLEIIEVSINKEYLDNLNKKHGEWMNLNDKKIKDEELSAETIADLTKQYENDILETMSEYYERSREAKIKLTNDIQALEELMEQIKALCISNSEKLEYSFKELENRQEEIIRTKCEQKKKINKFREILSKLNNKKNEITITAEVSKNCLHKKNANLEQVIDQVKHKIRYFDITNANTFMEIWKLNAGRVDCLLNKILDLDKTLHINYLNVDWKFPEIHPLRIKDLASYKSIEYRYPGLFENSIAPLNAVLENYRNDYFNYKERFILIKIAHNSDKLLHDKFWNLLENISDEDKLLVKMQNSLKVLEIDSVDKFRNLSRYFEPYIKCIDCHNSPSLIKRGDIRRVCSLNDCSFLPNLSKFQILNTRPKSSVTSYQKNPLKKLCDDPKHKLYLEDNLVNEVLNLYMQQQIKRKQNITKYEDRVYRYTVLSRNLSHDDINLFWNHLRFSKDRENFWNIILISFSKFHELLQMNCKLETELELVHKENIKIKNMLQCYIAFAKNKRKSAQTSIHRRNKYSNVSTIIRK